MRGGAIPLLAWGAVLAVLMAINWIWTGDAIQVGTFGFAVAVIWGCALTLIAAGRGRALEPGEPGAPDDPEAVPTASLGAVLIGVAVASIMFGLAFGRFLIYFGGGLLITSLGLVARELLAERHERRRWLEAHQR
jgi:Na+/H+-translocating membrane pyrophosphatase